jgi:hypothetical protein
MKISLLVLQGNRLIGLDSIAVCRSIPKTHVGFPASPRGLLLSLSTGRRCRVVDASVGNAARKEECYQQLNFDVTFQYRSVTRRFERLSKYRG